ncbi:MAG: winged helix-turn-helix transcriptional regulator [Acidimicrobiales bacterium]
MRLIPKGRSLAPTGDQMVEQGWSSRSLVHLLAGRWTLAVLAGLADGGRRYLDLQDGLDGITREVLTDTLRRAERDGLVTRHLDIERIAGATLYELSDRGRSLDEPLEAYWEQVEAARRDWGRRAGHV